MAHHTKDKGDIGLTTVIADLVKQEWIVSLPIQEHAPYDLVATKLNVIRRVQVKFRDPTNLGGCMEVCIRNSWGNTKKGSVRRDAYSSEEIDCFALTDGTHIAYISINEVLEGSSESFRIRVTPPKRQNGKRTRMVEDYRMLV